MLFVTGLLSLVLTQPYKPVVFVGESMEPTYRSGSVALTKPYTRDLHRGDIVVVDTGKAKIVKRVVFLPGDGVPQVRVQGEWVDGSNFKLTSYKKRHANLYREVRVPEGCLYLLGDNPVMSVDSRQLGFFREAQVVRVVLSPKEQEYPEIYPSHRRITKS